MAAAEASETVAKVRTEAASAISQSTDRLVQVGDCSIQGPVVQKSICTNPGLNF